MRKLLLKTYNESINCLFCRCHCYQSHLAVFPVIKITLLVRETMMSTIHNVHVRTQKKLIAFVMSAISVRQPDTFPYVSMNTSRQVGTHTKENIY